MSRIYQLVLLWLRDPDLFGQYQVAAAPVAARYGAAERTLRPVRVGGVDMPLPDVVNVVYYDSPAAVEGLNADPQFQAVVGMRTASVDVVSAFGVPDTGRLGPVDPPTLASRRYLVEMSQLAADGSMPIAPPGYRIERTVLVDRPAAGLPFQPDLIRIGFVDDATGHVTDTGAAMSAPDGAGRWLRIEAAATGP
jgi:hypothetical protein